jgi:3-hydroxyisobutyrate dehydrogenase-like beta-hydroxyacid dehydrogenase
MPVRSIGILHPGEMGSVAAASLANTGNQVYWASEGRSASTRNRATSLNLKDAVTIPRLCEICEAIVSVCPPEFAAEVADQVLATNFRGLYIDANAISPARVRELDRKFRADGITFVDGGIIGPAVMSPGKVWIYFSGEAAPQAAECFAAGPMQPEVIPGPPGQASALKMCFAAYSKGLTALFAAILATAENLGVRDSLEGQPLWPAGVAERIQQSAPKAWRFVPEMHEIAATFERAGLPLGFHQAAAEIYRRMAHFKNTSPDLEQILVAQASACETSKA